MSSLIQTFISTGPSEQVIQMASSSFARTMTIGTDWKKIRVACRIGANGTNNSPVNPTTGNPTLFIGVCSGTSSIFTGALKAYTSHSVGLMTSGSQWGYGASGQAQYTLSSSYYIACAKTGSTLTTFGPGRKGIGGGTIDGSLALSRSAIAFKGRTALFVDLEKNATSTYVTESICYWSVQGSPIDLSSSQFIYYSQAVGDPLITGHTHTGSWYIPIDETTNGVLDSVNFSWNLNSPKIVIADLLVHRFF